LKKYEFTKEFHNHFGIIVQRIRAVRSFGDVKAGSLGGFIQSERNLSHDGNCWVYNNSLVYLEATVKDDARALDECWIWNSATLRERATAKHKCFLSGSVDVFGQAVIKDEACCTDFSRIFDKCVVKERAATSGRAWCHGKSELAGFSRAAGDAELTGTFKLRGNGKVFSGVHEKGIIESWSEYEVDVFHG
jgi:hypothetical protein